MLTYSLNFYVALLVTLTTVFASPIHLPTEGFHADKNATFVRCTTSSIDPLCKLVKQPDTAVMEHKLLQDGTWSITKSNWTRESLKAVREQPSIMRRAGDGIEGPPADLEKRESAPPICTEPQTQTWFDQDDWGYCEAIQSSFAVTESWTVGLSASFDAVLQASFGFSWGQTYTLSDTRTCNWNKGDTWGCHSIWYQPLMSYHNGWANYQTHTWCSDTGDQYYDHQYTYVNVNQAANGGINQGNLGCGSGCGGDDHRQCTNGNNGGTLWGPPN
ncbi:hypothetical protein POJ06DRAFT_302815 [Lipomyces tetrasporus]|uniref:Uncharacterized protein n=1 Tax=Lipomyces tetrasporus TaxID=54092 RepID=A0AAD7VR88_9ASCO|nr:uncharacterized protein POJ06DRAFT_302815 [Lipomyces tetrasporus]KAJ8098963.1 hypothetical protein POJ06DRAFT_302815 [Lipomyces tetrasporus]